MPLIVHSDIGDPVLDVRHVHRGDLGPGGQALGRHIGPVGAVVAGHVDEAGVGSDPHLACVARRGRDRPDPAIAAGERRRRRGIAVAAGRALGLAAEVGAGQHPAFAPVGRLEHALGREIEGHRPGLGHCQRRHPHEVVVHRRLTTPVVGVEIGGDVRHLARAGVKALQLAAETRAVDDVRIFRVRNVVVPLLRTHGTPVAQGGRAVVAAARHPHRAAVLLTRIDLVGELVVRREVIELAGRLVVPARKGLAAVHGDRRTLVRGRGPVGRVLRVDPDEVVVVPAGGAADDLAMRATLIAAPHRLAHQIDRVRIIRRNGHVTGVVAGHRLFVVHPRPVRAAVVRAVEPALRIG